MIVAVHHLAIAALFAWVYPDELRGDVESVLADPRYEFCDPASEFVPLEAEREFCELVPGGVSPCPGFQDACLREVPKLDLSKWSGEGEGAERPERDETTLNPGRGRTRAPPEPKEEEVEVELPAFLATLAQALLWLLLAAGVVWLVVAIVRRRGNADPGAPVEAAPIDDEAETPTPATGPAAAKIVETDVERLLRLAQEAAARGDYRTAVDAAHAALLRRLDAEGLIEISADQTNGDYLRQVSGRKPELRAELRPVVREVEQAQFGSREPDRGAFARVYDAIAPLVRRGVLVLAAGLGLGAGLSGCDDDDLDQRVRRAAEEREHAELGGLDTGPLGARAVVQLLRRHDIDARHRVRTVDQLATAKDTILVVGDVELLDHEWEALIRWARTGQHLVIAIDGAPPPQLGLGTRASEGVAELAPSEAFAADFYQPLDARVPAWRMLDRRVSDSALAAGTIYPWTSLISAEQGDYALTAPFDTGRITVFADALLFTNVSLAVGDNATLVVDLLDGFRDVRSTGEEDAGKGSWGKRVEVVNSWTGTGAANPIEAIQNSRLTPLVLQLLASLLLFYWWRGAAFGALREPPGQSRRAFAEHVEALGLQYAKARATRHALGLYAGFAIERLRERLRPGTGSIYALAQAVAARTGDPEPETVTLLVEMHELRDGKAAQGEAREHLQLMRKIQRLLERTGGTQ